LSALIFLAALGGALVIARPEPVPANLQPPPRSVLAQSPAPTENEADPEPTENDTPDEPAPRKGYSLTRMDLENAMLKVRSHAVSCRGGGTPPMVLVKIIIAPSGAVTNVIVPAEIRGAVGECVAHALRAASFPAWSQPPVPQVEWTYALRFEGGD
jgi:hypothetical protein